MSTSLGFLTSTEGVGYTVSLTSAIVVSRQEELVYMIKPGERDGQFAQGFRISNSIFGRQLLHLWTYVPEADDRVKFRDFPAVLNHQDEFPDRSDDPFCNGFQSSFVGGDAFGNSEVREFLPFGPVQPDDPVHDISAGDPAERIGQLPEDMRCYSHAGVTAPDLHGTVLEIADRGHGVEVVGGEGRRTWDELGSSSVIVDVVGSGDTVALAIPKPKPKQKRAVKVPWRAFYMAMHALRLERKWIPKLAAPLAWDRVKVARHFLKELNGPVPHCWPFVDQFAALLEWHKTQSPQAEEDFKQLVRGVFKRLETSAPQSGSPGGSPRLGDTGGD
jgi:hypothetical protein